mgnify:CR=1 FL=1
MIMRAPIIDWCWLIAAFAAVALAKQSLWVRQQLVQMDD